MSDGLKQYVNLKCRFIHDDRARFCALGDTAWLQPSRAARILKEMAQKGIEDAIAPYDPTATPIADTEPPPQVEASEETAQDLGEEMFPSELSSPSLLPQVLLLNAKTRRSIARSLGGPKNIKTAEADAILSKSNEDDLKAASVLFLED